MKKIIAPTSKGQITLPKAWRDQIGTDHVLMETTAEYIVIRPHKIIKAPKSKVTTENIKELQKKYIKKPLNITRPTWDIF